DQPEPRQVREIALPRPGMRAVEVDHEGRFAVDEDEVAGREVAVADDLRLAGKLGPGRRIVQLAHDAGGCDELLVAPRPVLEVRRDPAVVEREDLAAAVVEPVKRGRRGDPAALEQGEQPVDEGRMSTDRAPDG